MRLQGGTRTALGVLLACGWVVCAAAFPAEKDGPEKRWSFGIPAASRCVYDVKVTSGRSGEESTETFRLTVLRPAARDVALLFSRKETPDAPAAAMVLVRLGSGGRLESDRRDVAGPARGDLIGSLFATIEGGALAPGSHWKQEMYLPLAYIPMGFEVEHEVEAAGDGRIRLVTRTLGERSFRTGGFLYKLRGWRREILVETAGGRPLSARVELQRTTQRPGEDRVDDRREVRAVDVEHERLEADACKRLSDEIARMKEVQSALGGKAGGPASGGLFGGLFRKRETAKPGDSLALLAAYEKAHPDGFLAPAVPALREAARRRLESARKARELAEKTARLMHAPAPDFTLQGLDGKKVSLSDYRGKAVLLTFWGYG